MTRPEHPVAATYYEVLGIAEARHPISKQDVKAAYHQALLLHHPDKSLTRGSLNRSTSTRTRRTDEAQPAYSVDDITKAYRILSDPLTRVEYDRSQQLHVRTQPQQARAEAFHIGLETVDLDDLPYDEGPGVWYRSCRCGEPRGFIVTECDLEKEEELGEVHIACSGCSLWLKLSFAVSVSPVDDLDGKAG